MSHELHLEENTTGPAGLSHHGKPAVAYPDHHFTILALRAIVCFVRMHLERGRLPYLRLLAFIQKT
jgi:hypothetical protein